MQRGVLSLHNSFLLSFSPSPLHSEALSALDHDRSFPGHTHHFYLFSNGKKDATNCKKAPITCALIETFPEAAGCRRGEVRFSVMPPHGHVLPFVGLTNVRLQAVLGLDVAEELRIRVAEEERSDCSSMHVVPILNCYQSCTERDLSVNSHLKIVSA